MIKLLKGSDLADYIKERQAKAVRRLKQASGVEPKLAIVKTKDDPVINTYVKLKKAYGSDIGALVHIHHVAGGEVIERINELNADNSVQGIIVQLPLADESQSRRVLDSVNPGKDVDGLAARSPFSPAAPTAILWLLAGHGIELKHKKVAIVGTGQLVGAPLEQILSAAGVSVATADEHTKHLEDITRPADIVVTATGVPGLITKEMVKPGAVVVDAGVAIAGGKTVGDVAEEVYKMDNLTITPQKGGIGPLTVCALFENLLRAAEPTSSASS